MPLQAQGADEQIPPQGAGTEHAAPAGKGEILGLVDFSTLSPQAGPFLCCGCSRQLGLWQKQLFTPSGV